MTRAPGITVAICTRDRPGMLARALDSLVAQSPRPTEILVVDNAPTSAASRDLLRERFRDVRYVLEPVPGLDYARNRALAEARAEVVAFIDDDAVAAPGWAEALRRNFTDPSVTVCTGRIEPLSTETEGQRLFEANGGFSRGLSRIRLPEDAARPLHGRPAPLIAWAISIGCGCSYAVRRDTARELGGFDEAMDLVLSGGGDHDLLWRALQHGGHVVYEPEALAWHEHRRELAAAHAQIVGHQRAVLATLGKHFLHAEGPGRASVLAYLAWRLLKPGVRLARRGVGRDPLPAPVLARMWWHCWAGLLAYPRARLRARVRREAHEW